MKAVIFDFFGVLVSEGFKQLVDTYCETPESRKEARDLIGFYDRGASGMNDAEFLARLTQILGTKEEIVTQGMGDNIPNRQLLDYIKIELVGNYKLSILSNAAADYISSILSKEDIAMFDDKVLSYQFNITKPQPEIYKLAAERLAIKPGECVFIDDSKSHCEGAEAVGMRAIFYDDFHETREKLEQILKNSAVADN